jgi:hypothetical protein
MPVRKSSNERRPYDNQYNRFCSVCSAWHLHAKGRKYWTCLTCSTRTERQPNTGLHTDGGEAPVSDELPFGGWEPNDADLISKYPAAGKA